MEHAVAIAAGVSDNARSSNPAEPRPAASPSRIVRFGQIVIFPRARRLVVAGTPVALGSRAFELLLALIEVPGEIVSKSEIIRRVWPTTYVDECNLRFQIAQLRKALGRCRDIVRTIPGRGYVFVAEPDEPDLTNAIALVHEHGASPRSEPGAPLPFMLDSPESAPSPEPAPMVVLIDNDPDSAPIVAQLLRGLQAELRQYESVEEFLSDDRLEGIACIVLEVWLSGRNGLEFQAEIERSGTRIPLIFISSADVPTVVRAMRGGAADFVPKPIRQLDLLDALRRVITVGDRGVVPLSPCLPSLEAISATCGRQRTASLSQARRLCETPGSGRLSPSSFSPETAG